MERDTPEGGYLDEVVSSRGFYRFSPEFYEKNPNAASVVGAGTGNMIVSNIFDKYSEAFHTEEPSDGESYVKLLGRTSNRRVLKYIKREFVIDNPFLDKYKVMMPEANGTGRFGETLSSPFVANPGEGATDTFISIGYFDTQSEAEGLLRYIKTKFARALLGVNKATQHNPKSVWKSIPLQDFTSGSDIDWTAGISDIDKQLYKKYGLSSEEIKFIESKVKEMD